MFSHSERLKRAKQLRTLSLFTADPLPNEQAAKIPTMYPEWKVDEDVKVGYRRYYPITDLLYECITAHTTQADYTPDITPALWNVIDVEHVGTLEDPIPAVLNMKYYAGKYYSQDGVIYLCTRDSGIALAYMPSDLVGQYFEVVV